MTDPLLTFYENYFTRETAPLRIEELENLGYTDLWLTAKYEVIPVTELKPAHLQAIGKSLAKTLNTIAQHYKVLLDRGQVVQIHNKKNYFLWERTMKNIGMIEKHHPDSIFYTELALKLKQSQVRYYVERDWSEESYHDYLDMPY